MLVSCALSLLPRSAVPESRLATDPKDGAHLIATAHVDFKIIIPRVLFFDVMESADRTPGAQTVRIMSNSRNVSLAASGGSLENSRASLLLSAAAHRVIAQQAPCSVAPAAKAAHPRAAALDAPRLVCTVSMP